jgi:prepilin-type N-terminal cleavage/methylation domain-containing protein
VFGQVHPMNSSRQSGFSLVELLVVMFVGALLAGLVTPVLGRVRQAGEKAAETSAAKNLITAYLAATQDHEGVLLKGYDENGVALDTRGQNFPEGSSQADRWPWRLAPYLNYQLEGAVLVNERASALDPQNPNHSYLISASPSMGMNSYFVGGHENGQPAYSYTTNGNCVTRLSQAVKPSMLIVFSSAWGLDPSRGKNVDGYYYVTAPNSTPRWPAQWSSKGSARTYGQVRMNYSGKAVTAQLDGSVSMLGYEELKDMRRWANSAAAQNNPNWAP